MYTQPSYLTNRFSKRFISALLVKESNNYRKRRANPMHTDCSLTELPFQAPGDSDRMSSDAGALLLLVVNELFDVTGRLAACFSDGRAEERIEHLLEALIGQRVFGLVLGYEDLNDHDRLRDDSVVPLALGRQDVTSEGHKRERDLGRPLAGLSTLNRLELGKQNDAKGYRYEKIMADLEGVDRLLVDLFLEAHDAPPPDQSAPTLPCAACPTRPTTMPERPPIDHSSFTRCAQCA